MPYDHKATTINLSRIVWRKGVLYVWRHQDVETIRCGRYNHSWDLSMPVKFFQILLSLFRVPKMSLQKEEIIRSGVDECSHKELWIEITWWTKSSWGGKSSGAFTSSLVLALNSASSSSSFSKERSHILVINAKQNFIIELDGWGKITTQSFNLEHSSYLLLTEFHIIEILTLVDYQMMKLLRLIVHVHSIQWK